MIVSADTLKDWDNWIVAKAVHDFHYRPNKDELPFNGYVPGSDNYLIYQAKLEELKEQEDGTL